jgi:hypothetical protein
MAVTAGNLYQDLKSELEDFQKFLTDNQAAIIGAVKTIKSVLPQVGSVIVDLIGLLTKLHAEVDKLDVSAIGGDVLANISSLSKNATAVVTTAEALLPADKDAFDKVLLGLNFASDLPSLKTLKADILKLIDDVSAELTTINA